MQMHHGRRAVSARWLLVAGVTLGARSSVAPQASQLPRLEAPSGLQLVVDEENTAPTLRVVLPGRPLSDRAIEVLFPEHVTAVRHGDTVGQHLYRWEPGTVDKRPAWHRVGRAILYEADLAGPIRFVARATLDSDGVRFRYVFHNRSAVAYDMIYAVTDPRLTSLLHDVRLERTYVHFATGSELLAAETPSRLTVPLQQWLPVRYAASFTWPVPAQRVVHDQDGITHYNAARRVDEPFIATVSSDSAWVVASFARTTGNIWSNPENSCQHVDPQTALAPGATAVTEIKILVLRGSLQNAYQHMLDQRNALQ
jgi:hypothetical protein